MLVTIKMALTTMVGLTDLVLMTTAALVMFSIRCAT